MIPLLPATQSLVLEASWGLGTVLGERSKTTSVVPCASFRRYMVSDVSLSMTLAACAWTCCSLGGAVNYNKMLMVLEYFHKEKLFSNDFGYPKKRAELILSPYWPVFKIISWSPWQHLSDMTDKVLFSLFSVPWWTHGFHKYNYIYYPYWCSSCPIFGPFEPFQVDS